MLPMLAPSVVGRQRSFKCLKKEDPEGIWATSAVIGFFFQPAVASKEKQENKKKSGKVGFMEMTYLMTYNFVIMYMSFIFN